MKTLPPLRAAAPGRRGAIAPYAAILALVLIALTGVAIDAAHVVTTHQQLQVGADAGALAAARVVRRDNAASGYAATRSAAVAIAGANRAAGAWVAVDPNPSNSGAGDVVVGDWDAGSGTFTPSTVSPNAVRVRARRTDASAGGPLSLFFGGFFGSPTAEVAGSSVATFGTAVEPLVLLLATNIDGALDMSGSSELDVLAGKVHVNSNKNCALRMNGSTRLGAAEILVHGRACLNGGARIDGSLVERAPRGRDPMGHLNPPGWSSGANKGTIGSGGTYLPGYYAGGISMSTGTARLQPGVYVLAGSGIDLRGSARIEGDGVMLYLPTPAPMNITGAASVELTPPAGGAYAGMAIWEDRQSFLDNRISTSGTFRVEGSLYLFCGTLILEGTRGVEIGQLVAYRLVTGGSADCTVTGRSLPVPIRTTPGYLVE